MYNSFISILFVGTLEASFTAFKNPAKAVLEEHIKHIAEQIPNATLKIIDGEGLGSYVVHRDKIAHLITEFLRPDLVPPQTIEENNNQQKSSS